MRKPRLIYSSESEPVLLGVAGPDVCICRCPTLLAGACVLVCALLGYSSIRLLSSSHRPTAEAAAAGTPSDASWTVAPRLPGALIIGARKAGTRALLEAVRLHPQVRTARHELHYFDEMDNYEQGVQWYLDQMPATLRPDQINIEKTPAYLTDPQVPARVCALNCSIKLIVILREPVERIISDYSQVHQNKLDRHKPHQPFDQLVLNSHNSLNTRYKPVRNSLYAEHIARWLHWFDLSQLHFVDGDAFMRDPLPELRRLEQFLGLPSAISADDLHYNETKRFYCFRRKCLGDTKGRPHVRVDPVLRARLRRLLRPHNRALYKLIGREFDW